MPKMRFICIIVSHYMHKYIHTGGIYVFFVT